jgi:hypothetical protein
MVSNMPMKALEQKNPMLDSHAGYFLAWRSDQSGGHKSSLKNSTNLDFPPKIADQSPATKSLNTTTVVTKRPNANSER